MKEVADKLKPVADAAEEVAARAVAVSSKGLSKLSSFFERRRKERK
jgi:hypothetical protein